MGRATSLLRIHPYTTANTVRARQGGGRIFNIGGTLYGYSTPRPKKKSIPVRIARHWRAGGGRMCMCFLQVWLGRSVSVTFHEQRNMIVCHTTLPLCLWMVKKKSQTPSRGHHEGSSSHSSQLGVASTRRRESIKEKERYKSQEAVNLASKRQAALFFFFFLSLRLSIPRCG
ncbi:hypothetical protein CGRA01v4_07830 [Colletotrichum graminicola]|nr:hypothetical protein CGRA01v4_07830 [Colletotrichum graminicola]